MKPLLFVFHLFVTAPAILGRPLGLTLADLSSPVDWEAASTGQAIGCLLLFGVISGLMALTACQLLATGASPEIRCGQGDAGAKPAGQTADGAKQED